MPPAVKTVLDLEVSLQSAWHVQAKLWTSGNTHSSKIHLVLPLTQSKQSYKWAQIVLSMSHWSHVRTAICDIVWDCCLSSMGNHCEEMDRLFLRDLFGVEKEEELYMYEWLKDFRCIKEEWSVSMTKRDRTRREFVKVWYSKRENVAIESNYNIKIKKCVHACFRCKE